jgi:glycosyltransferase involved in cell wall biosynthesis
VTVSVVIPCFCAETTIGDQLRALANQTWTGSLEVVLSDNGSPDNSIGVARAIAKEVDLRLTVVEASDLRGVSHARNVGVAASTGDVVLICDADDVVASTWVDRMVQALTEADFVGGICAYAGLNSPDVIRREGGAPTKGVHVVMDFLPSAIGANFGAWRTVIEAVGGWRTKFSGGADDVDFSWRAQLAGFQLRAAEDAVVGYRLRESLRAAMGQRARKAEMGVLLYSEYRYRMPGRRGRAGLRTIAWLASRVPRLRDRTIREHWCLVGAGLVGRVRGSIRYRTFYI